jgi:hypothetical protein
MPLGFDFYEPEKKKKDEKVEYSTEEEAIAAFIKDQQEDTTWMGSTASHTLTSAAVESLMLHASSFEKGTVPVPHSKSDYVCKNCLKKGHYKRFCQQIGQTNLADATISIKQPLPSGIPMSNYTKISEEEMRLQNAGQVIYYDKDRNWYIKKEIPRTMQWGGYMFIDKK